MYPVNLLKSYIKKYTRKFFNSTFIVPSKKMNIILYITTFLLYLNCLSCKPLEEKSNNDLDLNIDLRYFGKPSNKTGDILSKWNESFEVNPEEIGEYLEGDILFPTNVRNGLIATSARWKNGEIPYEIAGLFTSQDIDLIEKAIEEYHRLTCIRYKYENRPILKLINYNYFKQV